MRAYVYDTIRASLCQMTLDQSFESKEEISSALKAHLSETMNNYGVVILNALVTDLTPDSKVRDGMYTLLISALFQPSSNHIYPPISPIAMNEINASKRLKESAYQRAEGEKILKVKKAEAEAESMYLSGVGVARQRKAIMDGLK
jgi:regulator of protease activity HflC (stomatin/prohibitin superfamily)